MRARCITCLVVAAHWGCSGNERDESGIASAAPSIPAISAIGTAGAAPADARGRVTDASWDEVRGRIARKEMCWAVPIANDRAFVATCGGDELRVTLPTADALRKAVDAADPKHVAIGYATHYEAYREVAWPEAGALFPTGTVYEVEVNQNLRVFMSTTSDGTISARYATVAPSWDEVERLAKAAPPPVRVKLFRVEEIPWKRALELFAAKRIRSAGHVHVNRVFLRDDAGRGYLTIPPDDAAVIAVEKLAPDVPWTVE